MAIPKIIHYCWFGKNEKSKEILDYIETWKRYCPNYQIIEWNESNFDISKNRYVKEAYESKKWAFVSDYVRLYVIYHHGGIYMDTDVEVINNLDEFLKYDGFTGFETNDNPLTGIMACIKGEQMIKDVLDSYEIRPFILEDGSYDMTTNIIPFRAVCLKYGYVMNNQLQVINNFAIYPNDFFCPYDFLMNEIVVTKNTYTIHHFAGSWVPKNKKLIHKFKKVVIAVLGRKISKKISDVKHKMKEEKK